MSAPKPSESLVSRILEGILSCIWLYFPSMLFLFLIYYSFWTRIQGQDIMMAFAEGGNNMFRVLFFVALGFYIYLTWFTSHTIGVIKQNLAGDHPTHPKHSTDPTAWLRARWPRMAAYIGLAIMELAILQLPALPRPMTAGTSGWLFLLIVVASALLDYWISGAMKKAKGKERWIDNILFFVFLILLILLSVASFAPFSTFGYLIWMFNGVIVIHLFFIFYINRHGLVVKRNAAKGVGSSKLPWIDAILDYFAIGNAERTHFIGLNVTGLAALIIYIWVVVNQGFCINLGPLTVILLGFSFLLALANLITAFSVKWGFNLHFIVIVLAVVLSNMSEIHWVRQIQPEPAFHNGYEHRPDLAAYLKAWLKRVPEKGTYDTWFIMSDGGASRSGYWTASVLGRLEDSSRKKSPEDPFSRHLFSLAGTSGGEVGLTTFFSLLRDSGRFEDRFYDSSARNFLGRDYFSFTIARLLGPDYFHYIIPIFHTYDRAGALEQTLEDYEDTAKYMNPRFKSPFSSFPALDGDTVRLPLLFINTTRMQDGNPGLVTNLRVDPQYFGKRIDVLDSLAEDSDISLATAAIIGARFPYVNPAGRIRNNYFVDGGYFDNSGAGVTQELIRGILKIYTDSSHAGHPLAKDDSILLRIPNLRFNVLHITNSPVLITREPGTVSNISNDLFAPFKALIGAYDMQTTVNDKRLEFYLTDLKSNKVVDTKYYRVSLYIDPEECPGDTIPQYFGHDSAYSMNWFMSDTTKQRILHRIQTQPVLGRLLAQ